MQQSDWIALGAFFISCLSLCVSYWHYKRDSADLKVSADFMAGPGYEPYIRVSLLNVGRRPAYIHAIGGGSKQFGFCGQSFDSENGGLEIKESALKEFNYEIGELQKFYEEDLIEFDCLQYFDSSHKKVTIEGSADAIRHLRKIM